MKVGIIGWRGMVGSVLLQRMEEEKDLAGVEPIFFSTSQTVGLIYFEFKTRKGKST
jgi:aspartate-semialdehyde dehydrogenase